MSVPVLFAQTNRGQPVFPESFTEQEWLTLKGSYQVGDFLMPCCGASAIPKVSINGVRFFAHQSDECASAPESQWHIATKNQLARTLLQVGEQPIIEQSIDDKLVHAKPDVQFVSKDQRIAIEVQHSYQTLDEYLRRQKRYSDAGVRCYWLLYLPQYSTLAKATARRRIKREFAGALPPGGMFPTIPELPVAIFAPDECGGRVTGAGNLNLPLTHWLTAITARQFQWVNGVWIVA
ncbi:MAG: competence protein CoiA family protein [Verrucomicrobiota bacterium]